ncbi:hypothetical protein [Mycoplasma leonicaptivi]|uniref:hypothetical protein n=1 Tax=Mycoplasma leonicaptivi TaxID=36742 RepID=UPI00047FC5B9|nr:hypothetical protein [Mycoplasma leonicaptivi]
MDSFTNYDKFIAKFKLQTNLNISHIKKIDVNNKKGLLFEFDTLSNSKYKDFIFTYNGKEYKQKYDGNSKYFIVEVDNNDSTSISNIKYNNQILNFSGSIENSTKTQNSQNNSIASVSIVGSDIVIFAGGSLTPNNKYLITFKPDINSYRSDITLEGIVENNTIKITNALDKIDHSFDKYFLTALYDLQTQKTWTVNENLAINLSNSQLNLNITKIQFAKDPNKYNTFLGSINVNLNDSDLKQLKEKYFKLSFVDELQANLPPDNSTQQATYNRSTGFDWEPRKERIENNKYIYLNFDELKSFEFKNLTPGIKWKLRKVEIVHKHNLRTVKDFPIENIQQFGNNIFNENIKQQDITFTDALGTSFTTRQNHDSNITSTSEMFAKQNEGDYKLVNENGTADFNYTNYLNLNKFYLKELQKKYHLFQEGEYGYPKTSKYGTINYSLGNVDYNYGTIVENYAQKEFEESADKTTFTIKKKLQNFQNLDENKEAIINFNFFASPNNINLSYWTNNQNAYGISFSYNKLKSAPNQTLDNVKIDFIQNWEELYKALYLGFENNPQAKPTLSDSQLEELINQRLKAKVSIVNQELIIEIKAREGVINKDIYMHNLSQEVSTFVEKAQNYTSIMYLEDSIKPFKYVNEIQQKSNYLRLDGFLFERKNNFKSINHEEQINFDAMEWRTTSHLQNDEVFSDVIKRSFGANSGTYWLIGKVKPSDPNNYEFYVATNRHVPSSAYEAVIAPKEHTTKEDVSTYSTQRNAYSLQTEQVWEATGQFKIDGTPVTGTNATKRSEADLKIIKINIQSVINSTNNYSDRTKIAEHIRQWMTIKPVKISKKGRYIKGQSFVSLYTSTFPGARNQGARNIQARFNYFAGTTNEGTDADKGRTDIYRVMRKFKDSKAGDNNQLGSGSSGSGVFDDEGNIYGIHIGLGGLFSGGFIINSQRMNFLGELNDYNEKSFAYELQRKNRLWPSKYEIPDIFTEFEKPFTKE